VGNATAVHRLYELHVGRVFKVARSVCRSEADAEEVTQDSFVDALSRLNRFEPRPDARFIGWLLTLTLNRARKLRRQQGQADATRSIDVHPLAGTDARGVEEQTILRRRALLRALDELPERDRKVVALFYGAELTADEVASVVGVSAANVRKICERQRVRLLSLLEEAK
jgi:RNA polymerase sigma-70 factor (ECF subfamily)